jgi:hypothetical protein
MVRGLARMLILAGLPCAALAQPMTGEAVAPLLFAPTGAEVELLPAPFLPADQAELLKTVGATQPYYGAIAVSPDEGIMVEATVAAANHHSTDAASAAALAACDAKRKGATPCAVVALIRPAGWKAQPFQLSAAATEGFADYAKVRRDKALAISPATGAWGQAKGRDASAKAVADCAGKAEAAQDCVVVVEN